jgi:hypothetical protein
MVDGDRQAVARQDADGGDHAAGGGLHAAAVGRGDVDAGVARGEARDRRAGERAHQHGGGQRRERRGAGDSVLRQARERLHPLDGGAGRRAVIAVGRARHEPACDELELQRRDVPAAGADGHRTGAERGRAEDAEGAACRRADDAVGHERAVPLEVAQGGVGGGSREPVDAPGVDPVRAQRDLQRGDGRARRVRRRREHR